MLTCPSHLSHLPRKSWNFPPPPDTIQAAPTAAANFRESGLVGTVRQTGTGLQNPVIGRSQAASWRHSAIAAERLILKLSRLQRCRSTLKRLWIEAWTAANFCNDLALLNFAIARSRRRNGWCEFSHRLLSHRPHS